MQITSPLFNHGQTIPLSYTCYGRNINPPLEFHHIPANAQSLTLIFEDVDGAWVHWLVFNIPPTTTTCKQDSIPLGSTEGIANGGTFGYEGPCMKYFHGTHHYRFILYALDTVLPLPPHADRAAVEQAMRGHVIAQAELIGLAEGDGSALVA